jgi:thioredoxin reductase (NADPH)
MVAEPAAAGGERVDLAIVGAGPTGLYAAYYAGFRGMSVALVDALPVVGGQVAAMYPEKPIYDVAGFPAVEGAELVARLDEQARSSGARLHLGQRAESVQAPGGADGDLVIGTSTGATIRARTLLVAGGVGGFAPRPLPAEANVAAADIDHFVLSPAAFRGKDALVVGGGDSALDWALALRGTASSVTVVHRRTTFRAHAHSVRLAEQQGIRLLTGARVVGSRYGRGLEAVEVAHADGSRTLEDCHRVVAALGFTAQLGPVLDWGLDVVHGRYVPVGSRMQTGRPRVFAAGDLCTYDGKVPLISVGFGEAATAVNNAYQVIEPTAPLFGGHSTDAAPVGAVGPPATAVEPGPRRSPG